MSASPVSPVTTARLKRWKLLAGGVTLLGLAAALLLTGPSGHSVAAAHETGQGRRSDDHDEEDRDSEGLEKRIDQGRLVFRFDTFGDEQQWTDRLRMHEVIEQAVDPLTALQLGLKVDVDALPDEVVAAIVAGQVYLTDPATTLALIQLDAVVGVVGTVENVDGRDRLTKVGITCALCHSNVADS